jgi:ketosteroid isomerase-like protein
MLAAFGCSSDVDPAPEAATDFALSSLHAIVVAAHRERDPAAYAALHSDTVVFEWPMLAPVRGRPALQSLMRENWRVREDLDLDVTLVARRVAGASATEVLTYRESWTDPTGSRVTEYGRFVLMLSRASDGRWLIDRFFGFSDSTASVPGAR